MQINAADLHTANFPSTSKHLKLSLSSFVVFFGNYLKRTKCKEFQISLGIVSFIFGVEGPGEDSIRKLGYGLVGNYVRVQWEIDVL